MYSSIFPITQIVKRHNSLTTLKQMTHNIHLHHLASITSRNITFTMYRVYICNPKTALKTCELNPKQKVQQHPTKFQNQFKPDPVYFSHPV